MWLHVNIKYWSLSLWKNEMRTAGLLPNYKGLYGKVNDFQIVHVAFIAGLQ